VAGVARLEHGGQLLGLYVASQADRATAPAPRPSRCFVGSR
jgi:hypothetical protein